MLKSSLPSDPDERKRFISEQEQARSAAREAQRLEAAVTLLRPAIQAFKHAGLDLAPLMGAHDSARDRLSALETQRGARIMPRTRPMRNPPSRDHAPRRNFRLFIDESGGSRVNLTPGEPFFGIGGVLVPDDAYKQMEEAWLEWKVTWTGRPNATMHSRHLGSKHIRYYIRRGASPIDALKSLDELINQFEFTLFVMAINKAEFQREFGRVGVDRFLPAHCYEMCLDFLLERVINFLSNDGDSVVDVFAESRNRIEDTKLEMEYLRLQLEGTLFQPPQWFQRQLGPHIAFRSKQKNVAGLQLVDILLRATVEKLQDPLSSPLRWDVARRKLFEKEYDDGRRRVRGWGLKIFPHDDTFVDEILNA